MVTSRSIERVWTAPSNFSKRLDATDFELAQQIAKDPLVLDFLGLSGQGR